LALTAHVLRCSVTALDGEAGVRYRGALSFDERCEAIWEVNTLDGYRFPEEVRTVRQSGGHAIPGSRTDTADRHDTDSD